MKFLQNKKAIMVVAMLVLAPVGSAYPSSQAQGASYSDGVIGVLAAVGAGYAVFRVFSAIGASVMSWHYRLCQQWEAMREEEALEPELVGFEDGDEAEMESELAAAEAEID